MRIGVLTGEYPPLRGGVGDYTRCLVRQWAQAGHIVHLAGRPLTHEALAGVTVHPIMRGWGLGAVLALRRWAHEQKLDVLNVQYQTSIYDMSPWIHFLPRLLGVPVITTFHDLLVPYLFPKAGPVRGWIVRELARCSAFAVTTNGEDFAQLRHLPHARLIPIGSNIPRQAVPPGHAAALRARHHVPDDALWIGHFGFLYPNRGVEYLLEALALLRDRGFMARLVMIGGRSGGPTDESYVRALNARADALGLHDLITWTDFAAPDEVSRYLQAVDGVVLPFLDGASYRRGSLMAAIQNGCAIVTTTPAYPIEGWADGETMALVAPRSAPALADAMMTLQQPDTRQRYRLASERLAPAFGWEAIAEAFTALFGEAAARV
jgi:glycosyltransferase involved in cell wall biosynthesis